MISNSHRLYINAEFTILDSALNKLRGYVQTMTVKAPEMQHIADNLSALLDGLRETKTQFSEITWDGK